MDVYCPPQRYRLVSDDDGHHYLIPADKWILWGDFVESNGDWDVPEWARPLGGSPECVTFVDPRDDA